MADNRESGDSEGRTSGRMLAAPDTQTASLFVWSVRDNEENLLDGSVRLRCYGVLKILQELPSALLFPSFLLPRVEVAWELVDQAFEAPVVSQQGENV
jgi:hypothetical protein